MQARLREAIETDISDCQVEKLTLVSAKESLPGIETYHREGRKNFYASRMTDSEDDAREIMEKRSGFNRQIRDKQSELRDLKEELASLETAWPVGCEDVASMLEVKLGTVHIWRLRNVLPEPAGLIGGAPWWWRADIQDWAETTGRSNRAMLRVGNDS
jgi:hypothetical protein